MGNKPLKVHQFMVLDNRGSEISKEYLEKLFEKAKIHPKTRKGIPYLSLSEWYKIEKSLLNGYKKLKELHVSFVEVRNGSSRTVREGGKLFSIEFNQLMEYIPHDDRFVFQDLFNRKK